MNLFRPQPVNCSRRCSRDIAMLRARRGIFMGKGRRKKRKEYSFSFLLNSFSFCCSGQLILLSKMYYNPEVVCLSRKREKVKNALSVEGYCLPH